MEFLIAFLFIWGLCWALHCFSNYLDFEKPANDERRYKKQIAVKYGPKAIHRETMTRTVKKDMVELQRKAISYADRMVRMQNIENKLTSEMQSKLFEYYKNHYIDKYKLQYS